MTRVQKIFVATLVLTLVPLQATQAKENGNKHYPINHAPLAQTRFVALPLGAVKPTGWLKMQLEIQANGLTGHLDEFWPSLAESAWRGGDGESWERGPYYLDGLVPLAYLLEDNRLLDKVKIWMEWMLASGQPNGWFGPAENKDRWPLAVALKVLTQYYEATHDERAMKMIENYFRYLRDNPPDWPDKHWRGVRARENVLTAFWLYRRTQDRDLLKVAKSIYDNSYDWTGYFLDLPYRNKTYIQKKKWKHDTHVVNIAMATKYAGLWYQYSPTQHYRNSCIGGLADLDKYHGQVGGRFGGDEHLAGTNPTQGTELCSVVEFMFSMENLIEIFGDISLADRLEMLAYNALPGTCTADFWAHQYDQQANQVLVSNAKRDWTTNDDDSNIYGLEPNFGCCTANMHQGWPKFVSHMWMATHDQGLVAVAYGPNVVKAKVGKNTEVKITQKTDYPFDGTIEFTITLDKPTKFPLYFRIPGWADNATLITDRDTPQKKWGDVDTRIPPRAGYHSRLIRTWKSGDKIVLTLPMELHSETRYNNAASILRGPLYYSLKIGEKWTKLKSNDDWLPSADWQIEPTTPWNYGLIIDRAKPEESITVTTHKIRILPFDTNGASVVLKAKGRQIPQWQMEHNSAGETPMSPVVSDAPIVELELIPYGCTRLRITEFPVIEK